MRRNGASRTPPVPPELLAWAEALKGRQIAYEGEQLLVAAVAAGRAVLADTTGTRHTVPLAEFRRRVDGDTARHLLAQRADTASALLRQAAALVEEAMGKLDTTEVACCQTCGGRRFRSWEQAKVAERLNRTPSALRDSAERLEKSRP